MSYVLATTESKVRWYKYRISSELKSGEFELVDQLDLLQIPCLGDKQTAKLMAQALGLKTWRYMKI